MLYLTQNISKDNDSIIVDRGFTIDKELEPLNVKQNILLFLSGQCQLLKDKRQKVKALLSKYKYRKSQNTILKISSI